MKANVGGIDKILRIVVGALLLSLVLVLESPLNWWGLLGLVPLLTGLMGYCPLYSLFGLSSCPMERKTA